MLISAIILGLISSMHCIGMCGPIAMMLPLDRRNPARKAAQLLLYHSGRTTAYASLGLVFGLMGKGFYMAGLQQNLSIIAGVAMIIVAVVPEKHFARYNFSKPVYRAISKVKTSLGAQFRKQGNKALFITGVLNGYLPCGLVYAALFGAIAMQGIGGGIVYMMLYGLGTIPMMSAVVYASGFIGNNMRSLMAKAVPYAAALIGILFVVRGLGLDLPHLSPGAMSLHVTSQPNCR
jgi:sulfite exporter TauE/SafE